MDNLSYKFTIDGLVVHSVPFMGHKCNFFVLYYCYCFNYSIRLMLIITKSPCEFSN